MSGEVAVARPLRGSASATVSPSSASGMLLAEPPAPLKLPFAPGDVICDKYQVIGLIGAGGVAFVVAALHLELGEMVALKFLRPESLAHPEIVERFASEARAAARIKSEYVCRVYDVGVLPDGAPFIVMEYLEGKDLSVVLAEQGRLPVKAAVEYVLQVCEALACAHAAGIVHRDIKPENLFITRPAGNVTVVKVLDFGISKTALTQRTDRQRNFTKTMLPMGTPAYMSPEQIRACGEVDARSDVWALGCVLFELITGTSAFDAPSLVQLGAAILEREPTPLRAILPEAPQELAAIVLKCLDKDPSQRFQNVGELALALYAFGPTRARIFAERSSHILHSAGIGDAPADLPSIGPPPGDPPPSVALPVASQRSVVSSGNISGALLPEETPNFRRRSMLPKLAVGAVLIGALVLAVQLLGFGRNSVATEDPEAEGKSEGLGRIASGPTDGEARPVAESSDDPPKQEQKPAGRAELEKRPSARGPASASHLRAPASLAPRPRPAAAPAPIRARSAAVPRPPSGRMEDEPDVGF